MMSYNLLLFILSSVMVTDAAKTPSPIASPTSMPTSPTNQPTFQPTFQPTTTVLSFDDVTVDILGHSGKMTLSTGSGKEVVIEMDSIYEMNSAGNSIGNTGANAGKHSLNTFASTDFTFSDAYHTTVSGLAAKAIKFNTSLVNGAASLEVTTFIFLEAGSITPTQNETFDVSSGTVKFNVEVVNWPFCSGESGTPCSGEVGTALDLDITITGTSTAVGTKGSTFSGLTPTAGDAQLVLSTELLTDGAWVQMEDGYPLVTAPSSNTQSFTFRFGSFSSSSMYDPVITFADLSPTLQPTSMPNDDSSSNNDDDNSFFASTPVQVAGGAIIGFVALSGLGYLAYSQALKRGGNKVPLSADTTELPPI